MKREKNQKKEGVRGKKEMGPTKREHGTLTTQRTRDEKKKEERGLKAEKKGVSKRTKQTIKKKQGERCEFKKKKTLGGKRRSLRNKTGLVYLWGGEAVELLGKKTRKRREKGLRKYRPESSKKKKSQKRESQEREHGAGGENKKVPGDKKLKEKRTVHS